MESPDRQGRESDVDPSGRAEEDDRGGTEPREPEAPPSGANGPSEGSGPSGPGSDAPDSDQAGSPPVAGSGDPSRSPTNEDGNGGSGPSLFADVFGSVLAVGMLGLLLFAASGVWPPMVAVESTSMTPHMGVGDLVFVMEEDRFPGEGAHGETGIVTAHAGAETGYRKFQGPGDVIVFTPNGDGGVTPIIHRAMFWVEEGENWYDEADPDYLAGADSCTELRNCPAPHDGFITKGDANGRYDQVGNAPFSGPVKPSWVLGTAEVRVPWLGCIRLASQANTPGCSLLANPAVGAASATPPVVERTNGTTSIAEGTDGTSA